MFILCFILGSSSSAFTTNSCDQLFAIFGSYNGIAATVYAQRSFQTGKQTLIFLEYMCIITHLLASINISHVSNFKKKTQKSNQLPVNNKDQFEESSLFKKIVCKKPVYDI